MDEALRHLRRRHRLPPPSTMPAPVAPLVAATAPTPDPRVGLKAGWWDAGEAAWNMRMISTTPPTGKVLGATHSDLAFSGKYAIQGNYNGFEIYDISTPTKPVLVQSYLCPASQNDVSVYKNLLFMSSEATNSRVDCGFGGVPDPVSKDRVRGIRVFDITDVVNPKLVANVQTCRGSHTHTIVTQPGDTENVYIYVSGTARVRSADELPGCADGGIDDPNTARFRLEVIKVPIAAPAQAAIVSSPRIFNGLPVPPRSSERDASRRQVARGSARGARRDARCRTRRRSRRACCRRGRGRPLQDDEVGHARLPEPDARAEPAEASADDGDAHMFGHGVSVPDPGAGRDIAAGGSAAGRGRRRGRCGGSSG